jgi:hypothetical protein
VWFGSILGIKFTPSHTNFIDWLFYCLATLKEEELCVITALIYGIWFARNKMVFENQDTDDKDIVDKATSAILDYQTANLNQTTFVSTSTTINRNNNNNNDSNNNERLRQETRATKGAVLPRAPLYQPGGSREHSGEEMQYTWAMDDVVVVKRPCRRLRAEGS